MFPIWMHALILEETAVAVSVRLLLIACHRLKLLLAILLTNALRIQQREQARALPVNNVGPSAPVLIATLLVNVFQTLLQHNSTAPLLLAAPLVVIMQTT